MFERDAARSALLAVLVLGIVSAAIAPVSADVTSGDRTAPDSVTAGETVTVTVTATMNGSAGPFSLSEAFDGPVASSTVQNVTVDGESVNVRSVSNANGAVVTLENTGADAQVEVTYQLTTGQSAGTISITGEVAGGTTIDLGRSEITVEEADSAATTTTESTTTESTTETTESPSAETTTAATAAPETSTTTTAAQTTTTGDGPGFTAALALLAIVGAGLLALRRD
jgi:PGF-CTERM protein